jgi:CHASE2 domain-containing sensor protein
LTSTATRPTRVSPYKGLAAFGAEDASFFFGREREREVVIANLRARSLTVLYGESGVGKSSLLHAAVLSRLRAQARESLGDDDEPGFVPVLFSAWREQPVAGLLKAVRAAVDAVVPGRALSDPAGTLSDTLAAWANELDSEFFIILDQFEEYFLYHGHEEGREAFAFQFAEAVNRPGLPASFLLSIREDAFARLDRFKTLVPTLLDNYLRVRHLDERAAREAIERPLETWNESVAEGERVEADSALVDAVIREVRAGAASDRAGHGIVEANGRAAGEERIEAPYLQLVLTRLWDEEMRQGSHRLRSETLANLGGAKDIVQKHLDDAMSALPAEDREIAAAVFHYLVTPEGTKIAQSAQALAVYSGRSPDEIEQVLEQLTTGEARIVRPIAPPAGAAGGTRYEIFHDILGSAILDWRARHERARLEREKQEAERTRLEAERRHREMLAGAERRRRGLLVAVAIAALVLSLVLHLTDALDSVELKTVDARFGIRGEHAIPNDMVVVGLDDKTLSDLNQSLPYPRSFHGRVIDRLHRAGARLIVYDIEFRGAGPGAAGRRNDDRLLAALDRARPVILGATATNDRGEPDFLHKPWLIRTVGARAASALIPPEGTVRKFPYTANRLKSIGVVAAETLKRRSIARTDVGGKNIWIDYAGPSGTVPTVPFSRVLRGQFPADLFRNKVVVIGATALVLQDRHSTPVGGDQMAGPEIQANAINTARHLAPLRPVPGVWTIVFILLFSVLPPLAALRMRALFAFGIALGALALYLGASQFAFSHGHILPIVYPACALVAALFGTVGLVRNRVLDEHSEPRLQ